jgi:hypothetical protein
MLTLVVLVIIGAAAFVAYKIVKKEDLSIETKVVAPEKIEPIETKKESPAKKSQAKKTTVKKQK